MRLFKWLFLRLFKVLFLRKEARFMDRAALLLGAAQINAIAAVGTLVKRFPIMAPSGDDGSSVLDGEHWDFILTVAGVLLALRRLENLQAAMGKRALEDYLIEKIYSLLSRDMNEWKPDGIEAFSDCKRLWESEVDRLEAAGQGPEFLASDALGAWNVLNGLKHEPETDEELQLVRATGFMITNAFYDWWDSGKREH